MLDSLYKDLSICFLISVISCLFWSYRKEFLKERWKETVAVSVACGFIGFLFYLLLRLLVPAIGITPNSWLTIPSTVVMVWVYYDVLLLRQLEEGKDENA